MAILGTFDFDVTTVDPATVMVADATTDPNRAAAVGLRGRGHAVCGRGSGGCHELGGDGTLDLTIKYDAREIS